MYGNRIMAWAAGVLLAVVPITGSMTWAVDLEQGFRNPPASARPWVYWFWMDGNLSREGMTADLEALQKAGVGGMIVMEVNVGIPRGPVKFMSEPWMALFTHAVREAERLGLEIALNAGPGWTGSGGPWVKPEQSMQHVVSSSLDVTGPSFFSGVLPRPAPREPHFVHAPVPASLQAARNGFYRDVAVIAFPAVVGGPRIADSDEKALYYRFPYSSHPRVKPYLAAPARYPEFPSKAAIDPGRVVELTERLAADGRLAWKVPEGKWTLMRFGRTSTGANTRPAPEAGIGLECDKLDATALDAHFDAFVGSLLRELGPRPASRKAGWTMLHIDSWEMGAQNWTAAFREEFQRRRGYDPLPYLPAVTGRVVESLEVSERFLWDLRQTVQNLVIENHAEHLRALGRRHGFGLSIEPYDMNPCADLRLGGVADVPMCEFWARGYGFDTSFSCLEAVSIAHTLGKPIVAAEAFTASHREAWQLHPGNMKAQADWAFCAGINRLVFHRYAHQPWLDRRPGMTMGPYGAHYERTQTWWEMVGAWHVYVSRCQFMLRRGRPVADICYLAPEGAPHVFRPPPSALLGPRAIPDRRGYNFDGCAPETLLAMSVKGRRLKLPHGASYRVLVLPEMETMTPALLRKVKELVEAGATVIGKPVVKSPSLSDYPRCDDEVRAMADGLWGMTARRGIGERHVGKGRVIFGGEFRAEQGSASENIPALSSSNWIWHREGNPAAAAPVGTRHFRRSFDLESGDEIESARLVLTADNAFQVSVNGKHVGQGDNFKEVYVFDLKTFLRRGANLLSVAAENGGEKPNPAGLIGALLVQFSDGRTLRLETDRLWESADSGSGRWQPALELGAWGMRPWGEIGQQDPAQYPALYGDYESVARVLAQMGVPPDFESDGPLRYTHRREGDTEIYFVANREDRLIEAQCVFRVAGKSPELWHPVTGKRRVLPDFHASGGRTSVLLGFEPHESYFIVFRRAASRAVPGGAENFPRFHTAAEILGPWTVHFDPLRGGPAEPARFDTLEDWSRRPEEGIRHYSGTARYRISFTLPQSSLGNRRTPLYLDLGKVQVVARVKLNGHDLGVLWHRPFRLDITSAVRAGENAAEIAVANLWPNRLIGDQSLPADKRVAWSTWNPYKENAPLLASGLLGPVTLQALEKRD